MNPGPPNASSLIGALPMFSTIFVAWLWLQMLSGLIVLVSLPVLLSPVSSRLALSLSWLILLLASTLVTLTITFGLSVGI